MENADSHSGWRFKFLTHEEAAARIGCSPAQLRHLRLKGEITYFRFRPVLYDQADVDEFIARRDEARQLREAERERRKKAPQPELTEQEKLEAERRLWLHKTLWKIKLAQMRNAEKRAAAPSTPPSPAPTPSFDWAAHRARKRQEWLNQVVSAPDNRKLLRTIRARTRCTASELRAVAPHLDRTSVVRILKRLRDAGWLQVVGDRRHAVWEPTEELRRGMPQYQRPRNKRSKLL